MENALMRKPKDRCLNYGLLVTFLLILPSCDKLNSGPSQTDSYYRVDRFEVSIPVSENIGYSLPLRNVKDRGALILPFSYDENINSPTRLVIYFHSGGGVVTDRSSEAEAFEYTQYLVSLGYAVLDMGAMPEVISKALQIDHARNVGNPMAIMAYLAGYDYVVKNYNIDPEVFLLSNSGGGLACFNIINLTSIPVVAMAGINPLISIEQNAWSITSGAKTGGQFNSHQIRANIIRLFGMSAIQSQEDLFAAIYEKPKVGKFDPYDYILGATKPFKVPSFIIQTKDDPIVLANYLIVLKDTINKRNGDFNVELFSKGGHTSFPIRDTITMYKHVRDYIPVHSTMHSIAKFFEKHGGCNVVP